MQICNLRKLLGPGAIATIAGRGYRLTVPRALPTAQAFSGSTSGGLTPPPLSPAPAAAALRSTTLFGREDELTELSALLDSHRLVTIVGADGIGKTAMAKAVAHEYQQAQDGPMPRVDLTQLADGSMVCTAIANALNIHLGPVRDDMAQLLAALAQQLLLVLDNA